MKIAFLLSVIFLSSGCMYRVDVTEKHGDIIGEWRLKTDVYIIQYDDELFTYRAIPCTPLFANVLPDFDSTYSENRFGSRGNGIEIVGGLKEGSIIKIESVIEDHHATMGVSYEPFAQVRDMNGKPRKTNFSWHYRSFSKSQILNPEWTEKIR